MRLFRDKKNPVPNNQLSYYTQCPCYRFPKHGSFLA